MHKISIDKELHNIKNKDFVINLINKVEIYKNLNLSKNFINDLNKEDIFFITDSNLFPIFKKKFSKLIKKTHFYQNSLILDNKNNNLKTDNKTVKKIAKKIKKLQNYNKLTIIAFGSGTINDLCKIISNELNIEYIIIASSPSMNGYLSKNASFVNKNFKTTIPAKIPHKIYADISILKSSPIRLIKAGIADNLCFYSCWFDWLLSNLVFKTLYSEECFLIAKNRIDFLINNYEKLSLRDEKLIISSFEALILSGISMNLAEGSYPASQSEHLIAHLLDMKYKNDLFHGEQIAITTISTLKIQKEILKNITLPAIYKIDKLEDFFAQKKYFSANNEILKKAEIEIGQKNKLISTIDDDFKAIFSKNWPKFKKILQEAYLDHEILEKIYKKFKISINYNKFNISKKEYNQAILVAKLIRNRFTCLDFIN